MTQKLLRSIAEFLGFAPACLMAALFGSVLTFLYTFILVLTPLRNCVVTEGASQLHTIQLFISAFWISSTGCSIRSSANPLIR
jgi:hypothetical protein